MNWENDFEKRPARTTFKAGAAALIGLAGLSIIGGSIFGVLGLMSQPARVLQKTFDADNMIYNYEWFRQQYADIGAMQQKLDNANAALKAFEVSAGPRSDWKLSDRQQWDQLNRIVLGLQNQRATMVAAYNGNASKANRSIFLAGLPEQIN